MTKFLITGGAGFIGSRIVEKLSSQGHEVVIFDLLLSYYRPRNSNKFIDSSRRFEAPSSNVEYERGDTRHLGSLRRAIEKHSPDTIIHLAGLPIADMAFANPMEAIDSIIVGTTNVLECIRDIGSKTRFVYASSSMVYGHFNYTPCDEDHPRNPIELYGTMKNAGEQITEFYGRRYGVQYSIVRPSAVYGPGDHNNRVVQLFLEKALCGETLTVHGGGKSTLDFTYVDDTADGFCLAATHPDALGKAFNITCGQGRSLSELVNIIKSYIPELKCDMAEGDIFRPNRGALSIDRASEVLGYTPKYSLEDGLKKYHESLTSNIQAQK